MQFDKQRAGRKVSPSFLFVRGSPAAQQFLQKWREAANRSHTLEDGAVLDELLRLPEVNSALSIQIVSEVPLEHSGTAWTNNPCVHALKFHWHHAMKLIFPWHADNVQRERGGRGGWFPLIGIQCWTLKAWAAAVKCKVLRTGRAFYQVVHWD